MWIGDIEVTKKEIMVSIIILFIMLAIGFLIGEKIQSRTDEVNQRYEQAVKLDSEELFQYGMRTAAGDAFVEGDMEAVDSVRMDDIDGEYAWIERIKEKYTMHTRVVHHSDGKRSWTTTEHYWTWDRIGEEEVHSKKMRFAGVEFDWEKIGLPGTYYLETVKDGHDLRSRYYVYDKKTHGVMFAKLLRNDIEDAEYKDGIKLDEAVDAYKADSIGAIVFWIFWILVIAGIMWIIYCSDTDYLR